VEPTGVVAGLKVVGRGRLTSLSNRNMTTSRTARASAAPHKPDCICGRCIHRRRSAGLPEPAPRTPIDDVLARRALERSKKMYAARRAIARAERLLAQAMPAQKAPGRPGDPMAHIKAWVAAGKPDDFPDPA